MTDEPDEGREGEGGKSLILRTDRECVDYTLVTGRKEEKALTER